MALLNAECRLGLWLWLTQKFGIHPVWDFQVSVHFSRSCSLTKVKHSHLTMQSSVPAVIWESLTELDRTWRKLHFRSGHFWALEWTRESTVIGLKFMSRAGQVYEVTTPVHVSLCLKLISWLLYRYCVYLYRLMLVRFFSFCSFIIFTILSCGLRYMLKLNRPSIGFSVRDCICWINLCSNNAVSWWPLSQAAPETVSFGDFWSSRFWRSFSCWNRWLINWVLLIVTRCLPAASSHRAPQEVNPAEIMSRLLFLICLETFSLCYCPDLVVYVPVTAPEILRSGGCTANIKQEHIWGHGGRHAPKAEILWKLQLLNT